MKNGWFALYLTIGDKTQHVGMFFSDGGEFAGQKVDGETFARVALAGLVQEGQKTVPQAFVSGFFRFAGSKGSGLGGHAYPG